MKLNIQLFADGTITIGTEIDTKGIDDGVKDIKTSIDTYLSELEKGVEHTEEQKQAFRDLYDEYIQTKNVQQQISEQQQQSASSTYQWKNCVFELANGLKLVKKDIDDVNIKTNKVNLSFDGIGTSLKDIIGKVGKWTLAVFGLRSAYSFIRSIVSNIASTDDGISKKIEYVKWVIASVIKPAVEWVVNVVLKALGMIARFLKIFLGYNILDKYSVKEFEKVKGSTKAIKDNVKETRKALYGWDEMTRVDDGKSGIAGLGSALSDLAGKNLDIGADININTDVKKTVGDSVAQGFEAGITAFKLGGLKVLPDLISNAFTQGVGGGTTRGFNAGITALKTGGGTAIEKVVSDAFNKGIGGSGVRTGIQSLGAVIDTIFGKTNSSVSNTKTKIISSINEIKGAIDNGPVGSVKGLGDKLKEISDTKYKVNVDTSKPETAKSSMSTTLSKLKELAKKTWKIATKFTNSGPDKKTSSSWLQPVREALKKVGITIPKLAKGGIINLPSKGVPVGSAIAGERGQEGVIPLTDSQQMELLGQAIGKYITINASITNTMNGRIISRELQKIQQENSFANNR